MNFEFLTKIITIILNHQPWCWWWAMAGSAYCKIEVSIIFKYYPKIKLGCYYFTMYHVKLSLQHDIHEDYDDEILNQRLLGTLYLPFSMLLSPHYAKPELFPTCFCFSETEFVVLETDGWMLVWRGRTEREEGKDIKSYHRQSCLCWCWSVDDTLWILTW